MAFWFTTQFPKVLDQDDDKHGVWVSKRGLNSSDGLKRGDKVAIYEVQKNKFDSKHRKDGAIAVVAVVQVEKVFHPPEGPNGHDFWRVAEARLVSKDDRGLPASEVKRILDPEARCNFGALVNNKYGGRVTPIVPQESTLIERFFTDKARQDRIKKKEAMEGEEVIAEAKFRKRCAALVAQKKMQSDYRCEVCGMAFVERYGERGQDYIQVHHQDPVAMREKPSKTKLEDLNIVCANCHAMLHRGGLLTVRQLRRLMDSLRNES